MPLTATGYVAVKSPEDQQADADAARESQAAALQAHTQQVGKEPEEHGGDKPQETADENTAKLFKGVKKKPNPYLPTTANRHRNHEKP